VSAYQLYQGAVGLSRAVLIHRRTKFAEWVKKGFIPKDSAGMPAEDMGVAFVQGVRAISRAAGVGRSHRR